MDRSLPNNFGASVQDIAEAPDGGVLVGSGRQWGVYVRELRSDGGVRTLVQSIPAVFDPFVGGPSPAIGIATEPGGSALVFQGYDSRLVRVPSAGVPIAVAGTGQAGFSGDGGPAVEAQIHGAGGNWLAGVIPMADGSIVFTDAANNRLRRIRLDGIIETLAGSGPTPEGDGSSCPAQLPGGPAPTPTTLCAPSDVISTTDGGFVVSDTNHNRVRRIAPDGTITTIAGGGSIFPSDGRADGKPAIKVRLERPVSVAQLANGDIAFDDANGQVYRVARDGTFHTLLDVPRSRDFAGRRIGAGYMAAGLATTREGGLLIAAGDAFYLAPHRTSRTLVAIRDARVSGRHVTAFVDATQPARATLEVRSGNRTVARAIRRVQPGRQPLRVASRFSAQPHTVRVTMRSSNGAVAQDKLRLYTSDRLQMAYTKRLLPRILELDEYPPPLGCRRITARRIDCAFGAAGRGDSITMAIILKSTGVIWTRFYWPPDSKHPFQRHPNWSTSPGEPVGAPDI